MKSSHAGCWVLHLWSGKDPALTELVGPDRLRQNNSRGDHFVAMCSGSESNSYLRLIDFVFISLNSSCDSDDEGEDKEESRKFEIAGACM